ncbi:sulfatase [Dysgonomonas sp. Marseille-P4677]|uniref:sulfatase family protein n=1 Tax=Dysgonomonas sp. Marseille-P4677 TaxID=2364790 RepID=UPI00191399FA|nr:sulfatase [Dysgonomonas sp. Marseille-P4677]MBK5719861.1 sulfatase [Dysgonomonas sp. Marseille-P4677]
MNKNTSKYSIGVTALALSTLSVQQMKSVNLKGKRPNIIFILTDDQRWDAMGCAGNNIISTPNMDALANEGIYFQNAFSTTPISAASRASILTGMYERTHGYTFGQGALKEQYARISYPVYLKEHGYYTGFFGKLGIVYQKADELFDQSDFFDRRDDLKDRRGYYYKTIESDTVHLTTYAGYKARDFILNAPTDKPFCLSISFSAPHAHDPAKDQYFSDPEYASIYEHITIPPPLLKDDKYFEALPKEVQEGFNRIRWHWRFDTEEKYQQYVKAYYRMITQVDHEIGIIRKLLKDKGLSENTVIVFAGDNGYYLGDRQLADKWLLHDTSIRIPMIVYDPRIEGSKKIDEPVLNIDIPSTILDLALIDQPVYYQGTSLLNYYQDGKTAPKRESILFEHLWDKKEIPSSEGIRTSRWKYFRYRTIDAPEELYDLKLDPLETNNLALESAYREIVLQLRKECEEQATQYGNKKLADIK